MTKQYQLIELNESIIDNLPKLNEKIINKYQQQISREIKVESETLGIQKARQNANLKYGKFWRDRLEEKKIYNSSIAKEMSYL